MIYAVLSARPRVSKEPVSLDDVRANRANILFFGNFHTMDAPIMWKAWKSSCKTQPDCMITWRGDIHGLGVVLAKKYRLLAFPTIFLW